MASIFSGKFAFFVLPYSLSDGVQYKIHGNWLNVLYKHAIGYDSWKYEHRDWGFM